MAQTVIISIIGPDRIGLVSSITGCLFDLGGNLSDTTFAVLGGGAEFTSLCELSQGTSISSIKTELESLPELEKSEVSVSSFKLSSVHGPSGRITHRISVTGGDRPGLVACLSEVFVQFEANIVRLNAEKTPEPGGGQYSVTIAAWIPEDHADSCLAAITNTAGELGLDCRWKKV
jgi:glycine cleavage system transcriptional repressor